ncbi:proteoglycan 4 [Eupeodes corollae]|uniref:proteoglycan 4 n=1 Tax=Eupeodes corollae TaxID=290404 RepID=UPI0024935F1A|nr:proteoglycan 4 [Eupeodes corollae]
MPTPEANESTSTSTSPPPYSLVALRNTNITELAAEEADSFKANVAIMTQDQCLDNGHHQANSNIRSTSDKVSDDLNNSKNSVVSNGVNISVQEFNVDVNREYSTDLVIVQNRTVDTDSSPTGEVLPSTSNPTTETPISDCVNSKDISEISVDNIDANKSELAGKNIVADMTVITHQNSSENMRDIIANSDKANKNNNSNESQLNRVEKYEKNGKSDINSRNANKTAGTRRVRKLIRSENVNECELEQIEDPIERLNKLRASITSALSEVKGVLKQYSTEQSLDEQNESAPSKQPPDDGPVRFRFVRKIRRRSVFSEDDETEIPKTTIDVTALPIIENKVIEELPNVSQESQISLSNQDLTNKNNGPAVSSNFEDIQKPIETNTSKSNINLLQKSEIESIADTKVPKDESGAMESENLKTTKEDSSINKIEVSAAVIATASEVPKTKNLKTKKILKKDRRASIAAVEISQLSSDQPPVPIELKTQRRPSDSGTLVKQTTRTKAKTGTEKTKIVSSRKAKTSPSSKTSGSSTTNPSQTVTTDEKASTTLSTTEDKHSSSTVDAAQILEPNAIVTEDSLKQTKPPISDASTQKTPPANAESMTIKKESVAAEINSSRTSPVITEVNLPQGTTLSTIKPSGQTTPVPAVSVTGNADVPQIAPKGTAINTPAESTDDKLSKPEQTSTTPISSSVNSETTETPTKITDASKSEVALAPEEVSTKVTSQKPSVVAAPTHLQQVLKSSAEDPTKVAIPNQDTLKSKQLLQTSKTTTATTTSSLAKVESSKSTSGPTVVPEVKTIQTNKQPKMSTEVKQIEVSKAASTTVKESKTMPTLGKVEANKNSKETEEKDKQMPTSGTLKKPTEPSTQIDKKTSDINETNSDETSNTETDVPLPQHVPKDAVAVKLNLPGQESVEELHRLEEQQDHKETTPPETPDTATATATEAAAAAPKKKRKAKRKVVIRRIKRKLSKDDTFLHQKETPAELEICEKEIEEKDLDEEPEEPIPDGPKQPKSCLKNRQFEIGDVVMYAEHYKKTQVRWKKAVVTERITSISYKLNIEGEERPAHISYIKKFTDRKVNFGGKEYLEIDYAQIEENEEKERNYSIWNLV